MNLSTVTTVCLPKVVAAFIHFVDVQKTRVNRLAPPKKSMTVVGIIAIWAAVNPASFSAPPALEPKLEPVGVVTEPQPDLAFGPLDVESPAHEYLQLREAEKQFHLLGAGMAAVVIDSGINTEHRALRETLLISQAGPNNVLGVDLTAKNGAGEIRDYDGHGSAVASILAGREVAGSTIAQGIAPEAKIIPIKVYRTRNDPTDAALERWQRVNEGLKWVIDNREEIEHLHGVRIGVVNLSLGMQQNLRGLGDVLLIPGALTTGPETVRLIGILRDECRIPVVVAAGNNFQRYKSEQGMDFPAFLDNTISVGSVFDKDFDWRSSLGGPKGYADGSLVFRSVVNRCAPYSQRMADKPGRAGTRLFAPGNDVTAACKYQSPLPPGGSNATDIMPESGTSRAAPCVSGAILLMQEMFVKRFPQSSDPRLPENTHIVNCMLSGGRPLNDVEEDSADRYDNVVSTGANFVGLNVLGALHEFEARISDELRLEQTRLAMSPNGRPMKVMGVEIRIKPTPAANE